MICDNLEDMKTVELKKKALVELIYNAKVT